MALVVLELRTHVLTPGVSYEVADEAEPHRSHPAAGATTGARLFVVD